MKAVILWRTGRPCLGCRHMICPHGGDHGPYFVITCRPIPCSASISLLPYIFQGEVCVCTSRIYVERSIYPEFLERFVAAAKKWKTGVPSDTSNQNGALISKEHLEKVTELSNAVKEVNFYLYSTSSQQVIWWCLTWEGLGPQSFRFNSLRIAETQHSTTSKHLATVARKTAFKKAETSEQTPALRGRPSALTSWAEREGERDT